MTHELLTNRYNQQTPTHIQTNGCSVSTPIYITPTQDQNKQLLNGFRSVVAKQRLEMGFEIKPQSRIGVEVITQETPPLTPAEIELGMNEESLRYALLSRKGTAERLILKLQSITGIKLVSREAIEQTMNAWLDALNLTDEEQRTTRTSKTSKKRTSTPSKASSEC